MIVGLGNPCWFGGGYGTGHGLQHGYPRRQYGWGLPYPAVWVRHTINGESEEVSVTAGRTYPDHGHSPDIGAHVVASIVSVIGLAAALIGAYIAVAPDNGALTIVNRTWSTGDLVDTWAPWLLITGGASTAIGMAVSVVVDRAHGAGRWLVAGEVLLGAIGIAAVVGGVSLVA